MELSKPTNNRSEVLYTLIEFGRTSLKDFPYLAGFRTRISELCLDYNLKLIHKSETGVNRFGNHYTYKLHLLPQEEKQNAIDVYNQINKSKSN